MTAEIEIDPLEIFVTGEMPPTYQKLCNLDAFKTLTYQFPNSFGLSDVIAIQGFTDLPSDEKMQRFNDYVSQLANREKNGGTSNNSTTPRTRIKI